MFGRGAATEEELAAVMASKHASCMLLLNRERALADGVTRSKHMLLMVIDAD